MPDADERLARIALAAWLDTPVERLPAQGTWTIENRLAWTRVARAVLAAEPSGTVCMSCHMARAELCLPCANARHD
jgi:hypothetical protein